MNVIFDEIVKCWNVLREADEKFGFRKIFLYTTYIVIIIAIFNWKSIFDAIKEYNEQIESERHDNALITREYIGMEVHPYLVELRGKTGADRIMLFEFHNSINNLIGMSFKYLTMTDHAEPYGARFTPKYNDVNSEVIGNFVRDLKMSMFEKFSDISTLRNADPVVVDVLNNPEAVAACYQYMSVLGRPLGILVLEWHDKESAPNSAGTWEFMRSKCSQAVQDLNTIILKYKK